MYNKVTFPFKNIRHPASVKLSIQNLPLTIVNMTYTVPIYKLLRELTLPPKIFLGIMTSFSLNASDLVIFT